MQVRQNHETNYNVRADPRPGYFNRALNSSLDFKHPPARYTPPDLNFSLSDANYEFLKPILRLAKTLDKNGPGENREPTKLELEVLIAKMLVLRPSQTFEAALRFLKECAEIASLESSKFYYHISPNYEIFFSAIYEKEFKGGPLSLTSNIRLRSDELVLFCPTTTAGEKRFLDNIFLGVAFFGKPEPYFDGNELDEHWRKVDRSAKSFGNPGTLERSPESEMFNPAGITRKDMALLTENLKPGEIGLNSAQPSAGDATDEHILRLASIIFDHSRSKKTEKVVGFLKSIAFLAAKAGSPALFSIKDNDSYPPRVFFSIQNDGLLHNANVTFGKKHAYRPVKPGASEPEYAIDNIFFALHFP